MRRDQLEHAIRTGCQIIGHPEVIILGSQAILGSIDEADLPAIASGPPVTLPGVGSTHSDTAPLGSRPAPG